MIGQEDVWAPGEAPPGLPEETEQAPPRKYYVEKGSVEIAAHLVSELDAEGKQLRVVRFTDYTAERFRSMYPSAAALRSKWSRAEERAAILAALEERGIGLEELMAAAKEPDAGPFDLLCHMAFNAPLRTRREGAEALRRNRQDFFDAYAPRAREVLKDILEKYIDCGVAQFKIPEILKVPPISDRGTVMEIAAVFGGAEKLRSAVNETQTTGAIGRRLQTGVHRPGQPEARDPGQPFVAAELLRTRHLQRRRIKQIPRIHQDEPTPLGVRPGECVGADCGPAAKPQACCRGFRTARTARPFSR